jgi:hypothetical protein
MTVADMTRPVTTQDEIALFFQLHPQYTKNSKTDWAMMTREWNNRVTATLQQQHSQQQPQLALKLAKHLQQFEKSVVMELARREACGLMQATESLVPAAPVAATLEQAVSGLITTMLAAQKKLQDEQQAARALADMQAGSDSAGQQAKKQKGQGVGRGGAGVIKTCSGCSDQGIKGVPISEDHKATCKWFGAKFRDTSNKIRLKKNMPAWTDAELQP